MTTPATARDLAAALLDYVNTRGADVDAATLCAHVTSLAPKRDAAAARDADADAFLNELHVEAAVAINGRLHELNWRMMQAATVTDEDRGRWEAIMVAAYGLYAASGLGHSYEARRDEHRAHVEQLTGAAASGFREEKPEVDRAAREAMTRAAARRIARRP